MSDGTLEPVVADDAAHHRLIVEKDGQVAELVYRHDGNRVVLVHTGVPDELAGRGIAGALVRSAIERAAAAGWTVVPWCPYARRWLRDHADVASTVDIDWSAPP